MLDRTQTLLDEREKTHGDYREVASLAQGFKGLMRRQPGWVDLTMTQQESLDMIATKIARILSGDAHEPDHYKDIAGYALLPLRGRE